MINWEPSPLNEPVKEPVADDAVKLVTTAFAEKIEPDSTITEPVVNLKLPVICTPPKNDALCAFIISKSPRTDAVTEPLANIAASMDDCTFLKFLPSPLNEPVKEPVADDAVTNPAFKYVCISTEPVNSCLSFAASPNLFEPDE